MRPDCLAFAADARVVSPKAVNGQLSASVEFAALQAGQRQSRKQPFVMPRTQSSLRRLRKLVCAAGHPRLAFLTHERRGWPGQARPRRNTSTQAQPGSLTGAARAV